MESATAVPNPLMILPFGLLLATIALAPLWLPGWWHKHHPKVAYALVATFLGFVFKYTLPYLLPMLVIVWWLFFRR